MVEMMGVAKSLSITQGQTVIIGNGGGREEINGRVAQIKRELGETDSLFDTQKLSERIAKLTGGIGVLKVGGVSPAEREDRVLRVEDAKNAAFAAVEGGVLPGGGAPLVHLSGLLG